MKSCVFLLTLLAAAAYAQSPAEFEVASVRPNTLNDRIVTIDVGPGNRFSARGYTLVLLMQRAYGVMDWNVLGGPSWIRDDRFDVVAKANTKLSEEQLQPMLQRLLADRFQLRLHKGTKETSGYALIAARNGPRIKPASGGANRDSFRMRDGVLSGQGISMDEFARWVGGKLGIVVANKTGLDGIYDFDARWTVEPDPNATDPKEALRTAVFAALQEHLGLRIIPQRIAIETLTIDSVEKPSSN